MNETAPAKNEERSFLASIRFLFVYFFVGVGTVGAFLGLIRFHPPTLAAFLAHLLYGLLPYALLCTVISVFCAWLFRVRVSPSGIRGMTFWGTPVYMTWAEMQSVKPGSLLGVSYIRVASFRESCPPLWIPGFLAAPTAFKETVAGLTSPIHPLRRSLEKGGSAEERGALASESVHRRA